MEGYKQNIRHGYSLHYKQPHKYWHISQYWRCGHYQRNVLAPYIERAKVVLKRPAVHPFLTETFDPSAFVPGPNARNDEHPLGSIIHYSLLFSVAGVVVGDMASGMASGPSKGWGRGHG